ncbi:MAG: helix-turn-helix domain-containing protein [Thermoplasmatota archaeon]
MYEAIVDVNLDKCWIGKTLSKFPISINILDTIPFQDTGVQDLVEVDIANSDPDKIVKFIRGLDGVVFVTVNRFSSSKRMKMIVGTNQCLGCRALADSESFLIGVRSLDRGWAQWRVLVEDESKLDELSSNLKDLDMEHKLVDITEFQNWDTLTDMEELVLSTALNDGYYDFPKRVGIRELSKKLNVSTAYISYTLRSGQKKAIQKFFGIKDR